MSAEGFAENVINPVGGFVVEPVTVTVHVLVCPSTNEGGTQETDVTEFVRNVAVIVPVPSTSIVGPADVVLPKPIGPPVELQA